jgi:hypothetical protein
MLRRFLIFSDAYDGIRERLSSSAENTASVVEG